MVGKIFFPYKLCKLSGFSCANRLLFVINIVLCRISKVKCLIKHKKRIMENSFVRKCAALSRLFPPHVSTPAVDRRTDPASARSLAFPCGAGNGVRRRRCSARRHPQKKRTGRSGSPPDAPASIVPRQAVLSRSRHTASGPERSGPYCPVQPGRRPLNSRQTGFSPATDPL